MSALQVFNNDDFGRIRAVEIDGEPWLVGNDVASMLGYTNPQKALRDHVDSEDLRGERFVHPLGGEQNTRLINESGVYSLILSSKLPKAKEVKRWITSEVMPSIRKHGVFATEDFAKKVFENPQFMIDILEEIQRERARTDKLEELVGAQGQQIAEMRPKANYYDLVLACKDAVAISVIAKDYGMSAQKLNSMLHDLGIQYKQGSIWLLYQDYAKEGYTTTKTQTFLDDKSELHSRVHTYWTQKGRLFIYEVLKKEGIAPLIEQDPDIKGQDSSGEES